jgi:RNA polymerase sigma-70 factor (ECF subfamily)
VEAPVEDYSFAIESRTIDNGAQKQLMYQELMGLLDKLSDLYKVPFLMHFKGYQYQEIAEQLDIPMGTVKSRIFFARRKMKDMIKANYGPDFRRKRKG